MIQAWGVWDMVLVSVIGLWCIVDFLWGVPGPVWMVCLGIPHSLRGTFHAYVLVVLWWMALVGLCTTPWHLVIGFVVFRAVFPWFLMFLVWIKSKTND